MSGNISVVCNYEGHNPGDAPGYVQFTRSADRVFIVVNGRPAGSMEAAEFVRVQSLITDSDMAAYAIRHGYGR